MDNIAQNVQSVSARLEGVVQGNHQPTFWEAAVNFFFTGSSGMITAFVAVGGVSYFLARRFDSRTLDNIFHFINRNRLAASAGAFSGGAALIGSSTPNNSIIGTLREQFRLLGQWFERNHVSTTFSIGGSRNTGRRGRSLRSFFFRGSINPQHRSFSDPFSGTNN